MGIITCRADFFDASALVKVFGNEHSSDVVRTYFNSRPTKYTTPFCFYEAMNVLKAKWKYQGQTTADQYFDATFHLTAWYGSWSDRIPDMEFADPITFNKAREIAQRENLDLSDAFQIISVKHGYFSRMVAGSATVLVTADKELARVARVEGLRVWSVTEEAPPTG